jgi:hypothetical protein
MGQINSSQSRSPAGGHLLGSASGRNPPGGHFVKEEGGRAESPLNDRDTHSPPPSLRAEPEKIVVFFGIRQRGRTLTMDVDNTASVRELKGVIGNILG